MQGAVSVQLFWLAINMLHCVLSQLSCWIESSLIVTSWWNSQCKVIGKQYFYCLTVPWKTFGQQCFWMNTALRVDPSFDNQKFWKAAEEHVLSPKHNQTKQLCDAHVLCNEFCSIFCAQKITLLTILLKAFAQPPPWLQLWSSSSSPLAGNLMLQYATCSPRPRHI